MIQISQGSGEAIFKGWSCFRWIQPWLLGPESANARYANPPSELNDVSDCHVSERRSEIRKTLEDRAGQRKMRGGRKERLVTRNVVKLANSWSEIGQRQETESANGQKRQVILFSGYKALCQVAVANYLLLACSAGL